LVRRNLKKPKLPPIKDGELLWKDLKNLPRKVAPGPTVIEYRAPTRVNFNILDFTEMRPNIGGLHCNSGSISIGIGLYSKIRVKLTKAQKITIKNADKEDKLLLTYYAQIFKKLTQYKGGIDVEIKSRIPYKHVGLGSTACLSCTFLNAINTILGCPFSEREIVKIGAFNYVEVGQDGKLYPGLSTGASGWVALKGGFNIVCAEAELAFREEIPSEYKVIVGIPPLETGGVAESDIEIPILERFNFHDRFNSAKICQWTLMKIIPSLREKDYRSLGDLVWEMTLASTKGVLAMLAFGSIKPLECLMELRKTGAEMSFMSSVGPAIITLSSPKYKRKIQDVYKKFGCKTLNAEVDNEGGKIL